MANEEGEVTTAGYRALQAQAARGSAPHTNELAEPSAGADTQGQLHQGAPSVAGTAHPAPRRQARLPSVPQAPLPEATPAPVPHYRPGTQFGLSEAATVSPHLWVGLSPRLAWCSSPPRGLFQRQSRKGARHPPKKNPEPAKAGAVFSGGQTLAAVPLRPRSVPRFRGARRVGALRGSGRPSLHCASAPGGGGRAPILPPLPPPAARSCFGAARLALWGGRAPVGISTSPADCNSRLTTPRQVPEKYPRPLRRIVSLRRLPPPPTGAAPPPPPDDDRFRHPTIPAHTPPPGGSTARGSAAHPTTTTCPNRI